VLLPDYKRSDKSDKALEKSKLVKLTMQYRAKRGMVYEFEENKVAIAVHITPRSSEEDSGDWHVEVRSTQGPDSLTLSAWGATRPDALREIGRVWASRTPPTSAFDWEGIVRALHLVHVH
jgi:hypothetical protein